MEGVWDESVDQGESAFRGGGCRLLILDLDGGGKMKMFEKLANRIGDIVYDRFSRQLNHMSSLDSRSVPTTVADLMEQLKDMPPNATVKIAKGAFIVGNYTHLEKKDVVLDLATDTREPSVILYADWYSSCMTKGVDY